MEQKVRYLDHEAEKKVHYPTYGEAKSEEKKIIEDFQKVNDQSKIDQQQNKDEQYRIEQQKRIEAEKKVSEIQEATKRVLEGDID